MALISIPTRGQARSYDRETQASLQQVASIFNNRYRGAVTISDTGTSATVLFRQLGLMDQGDTTYHVFVTKSGFTGTPADDSFIVKLVDLTTAGFVLNIYAAPGTGNSVTFAWKLFDGNPTPKDHLCNANLGAPGDSTTTGAAIVNVPPLTAITGPSRDRDVRDTLTRIKSVIDSDYIGEVFQTAASNTYYFADFNLPDQVDSNYDVFLIPLERYVTVPPDYANVIKRVTTYTDRFTVDWVAAPDPGSSIRLAWKLFKWL